jgi:asparagine synthase (glutamine-hydrolysing)
MFLSGGVDSSTIACLIRQGSNLRMLGKCGGGGDGDSSDDFTFARHCADHVGFDFDEVRVHAEEYYDCWQWMLDQYAPPLSTPTDVILFRLAEEMKKSVGVVLGGEGADELLCGYSVSHWAGYDFDRALQLFSGSWAATPEETLLFRDSLRNQYGREQFTSPVDHYFALNSLIPTAAKGSLFQARVWKAAGEDQPMWDCYDALFCKQSTQETQRKQTAILHHVNLEGLLSRLDSATMLAGLEARVPYTDHLLVEKMFRLPRKYKIDVAHEERKPYLASGLLEQRGSLRSKRVLRSVAERLMPHSLAHRKKASFPTPVQSWLSGEWQNEIRETLLNSPFGREVFRPQALTELAENLPQAGMWLWPIVNVLHWGDRQFAA